MNKRSSTTSRRRPNRKAMFFKRFSLVAFAFAAFALLAFAAPFRACADEFGRVENDPFSTPTWARRAAQNGAWTRAAGNFDRFDDVSNDFSSVGSAPSVPYNGVYNVSRSGFSTVFSSGFSTDSTIFRAQDATIPPVVSPTASSSIGTSIVANSTTPVVLPPVVGEDAPFAPVAAPTNDESTTFQKMFKYRQDISASYLYMPRGKTNGLGVQEVEARLLFAIPCNAIREHSCLNNGFFLLTPSFVYNYWSQTQDPAALYQMPDSTFDVGLSTMFAGRLRDFEIKFETQIGVAASFQKVNADSIYVRGRAMGALPIDDDKKIKATGGLVYYDRIRYKIVPSGGLIWTPNAQNVVELVYPDPRWSRYLTKVNETDWWFYIRGEIGGGRWLISDRGKTFNTDYNDYRVGLGLTFDCTTELKGCFELGGAFGRRLVSKDGTWYSPKDSVYLKAGLLF